MPRKPHLRVQPVAQHMMEHLHGGEIARRIELCLVPNTVEQHVERAFEPPITEIVEAGRVNRLFQQEVPVEPRRIDHPQPAPTPDHAIRDIDETGSARWLDRLVVQAGWPFQALGIAPERVGTRTVPRKGQGRGREVSGQGQYEKA